MPSLSDCFHKRLQAFTEVFQVVSLPDEAHAAAGDKHAFFTQFIAAPVLTMSRELNGVLNNRTFSGLIGTRPSDLINFFGA